ncbi:uncharacterized protein LOC127519777 isoform X4 [Ctenopharyngodon idella]|uniref:uncharacterized protein LOC127519777 isoform X4 n=1 Tax=Ctenopharyngodon idella TaxID=7959 RepID=UPI00222F3ACF|nr:uncharacterized protein LOC127519777 isoform X4 [Ctenopharyngodon idella]
MTLLFYFLAVILLLIDNGASGVDTDRVSVKEGDSVTFHTGVQTNQQEVIKWYFNDIRIAEITGDLSYGCTDVRCNEGTERFRDRLKLDHQTGSLTITNTRNTDSGVYELRSISSSDSTDKTFNVTVTGVSAAERDEMKSISVKEGESVTLDPDDAKTTSDVISWFFLAKITEDPNKICSDVQCNQSNERFRDRLTVNQNGSLTMMNSRITDSGLYKLQINSSRNSFSISRMKIFSVSVIAVPGSDLSPDGVAVINAAVISVLLVVAVTVTVVYCRHRIHTAVPQNEKKDNSLDLKDIPLKEEDISLNQTEANKTI